MTSSNTDSDNELRGPRRARRAGSGDHPAPRELVDYAESRLPPATDDEIRDHLVDCAECSALLLELERLKDTREPEAEIADLATEAAWRRLRARLFGKEPSRAGLHWAWGLAATFAVAALGLGAWTAALHRTVAELRAPQLDLPIVGLEPVGSIRGDEDVTPVRLPADAVRWALILHVGEPPDHPAFRLEFRDGDGRPVARSGLRQSAAGDFRLSLPRDFLPPGEYRILLYGTRDGEHERIGEYALRIAEPGG